MPRSSRGTGLTPVLFIRSNGAFWPPPLRPAVDRYTLDDVAIDEPAGTVTCPAGITVQSTRAVLGSVKEGRLYGTKATCAAGSTLKHRLFGRT